MKVAAPCGGYVARFGASGVGRAALSLGAGREKKGDDIDPGAGVEVLVRAGERVEKGQPVAALYGSRSIERAESLVKEALEALQRAGRGSPLLSLKACEKKLVSISALQLVSFFADRLTSSKEGGATHEPSPHPRRAGRLRR